MVRGTGDASINKDDRSATDDHDELILKVAGCCGIWCRLFVGMRGAFLAFECEKAYRICTCIGELDTGEIKFRQSRFWTSLLHDSKIS